MIVDYRLTNRAYEIASDAHDLAETVEQHEQRRRDVSSNRGYECGHVAEWYPRGVCKTAIQREIRRLRRELLELSKEFDRAVIE